MISKDNFQNPGSPTLADALALAWRERIPHLHFLATEAAERARLSADDDDDAEEGEP